jgi:hypothetical protein
MVNPVPSGLRSVVHQTHAAARFARAGRAGKGVAPMTNIAHIGGISRPAFGLPLTGAVGAYAWRVRPFPGQSSVPSVPSVTDAPMTKPPHVSASERCP